jgi:hypothetical protein
MKPFLKLTLVTIICILATVACRKNENHTNYTTYDFSYGGYTHILGDSVFFQSSAPAGSSVLWSFGDGDTSTAFTPKHVYLKSGLFKVTLTVNDDPQAIVRNIQIKSLLALTVSAPPHGGVFLDRDTVHFIGTGALSGSMYIWSVYFYPGQQIARFVTSDSILNYVFPAVGSYMVYLRSVLDSNNGIANKVDISLYPKYTSKIPSVIKWHHQQRWYLYPSGGLSRANISATMRDTAFAFNYLDDFRLSLEMDTLTYCVSSGNMMLFSGKGLDIGYDFSSGSIYYRKFQSAYHGSGNETKVSVDYYYSP